MNIVGGLIFCNTCAPLAIVRFIANRSKANA